MRAYNNSTKSSTTGHSRSTPSCSYCSDPDHQVTSCPHVKSDWAMFQSFNIPCSDPDNWTNNPKAPNPNQRGWGTQQSTARWFKDPSGWSKWHAQCEKAYGKVISAEHRAKIKASTPKQKRVKSCGFCGGIGHNRRDCPEMQALNKRLIRANNHWRRRLYNHLVENLGLGNGALIKVSQTTGWQKPDVEKIGIVTSINWDELNMFCYVENGKRGWRTSLGRVHENLHSPFQVKAMVDGEEINIGMNDRSSSRAPMVDQLGRPLIDVYDYSYKSANFISVVSPTEEPLSEDWLNQGQAECVEFITKRYSLSKLKDWNAICLLEKYESRFNLK